MSVEISQTGASRQGDDASGTHIVQPTAEACQTVTFDETVAPTTGIEAEFLNTNFNQRTWYQDSLADELFRFAPSDLEAFVWQGPSFAQVHENSSEVGVCTNAFPHGVLQNDT